MPTDATLSQIADPLGQRRKDPDTKKKTHRVVRARDAWRADRNLPFWIRSFFSFGMAIFVHRRHPVAIPGGLSLGVGGRKADGLLVSGFGMARGSGVEAFSPSVLLVVMGNAAE
jgi:hypothetical protein